ncbi:ABC transporter ATP-binding protein [Xenophilus sp. Marseille-Q4582]|uniref:ABC transporter ATP-binding protein n=1 Tax=Xenophilus sp. Marseille-Q4582 TaxID=2866600 RepID=UPI001CE4B641|nr:ABC transporter ATP-binding protein [Xenophilus sp. Marseille-Q4582]
MDSPMHSELAIRVRGLSKYYEFEHVHEWSLLGGQRQRERSGQGYLALSDISFEIPRGQAVGLIGRNGAGKSTLLKILTGSLRPSEGEVEVRGRVSALLELGAGFNSEFTGRENIFLVGAVLGMSEEEVRAKYQAIVDFADIGVFIDKPVKSYSSGMMVRLAFALQVHVDPDILIIDEALSVGDIFFQQKCIAKIREILERNVTLLFVSHGLNSVKSLCSRAIHLDKGCMRADGPAEEVCNAYQNAMTSVSTQDWRLAVEASKMAEDGAAFMAVQRVSAPTAAEADPDFERRLTQQSGSGEIRFTGLTFVDAQGRPVTVMEQAGSIRLRAYLQAHASVPEGAAIGILVRDAAGVDLIAFNSDFYQYRLPAFEAGRTYIWELDLELPLARGYYSFQCGIKPHPQSDYFYHRCFNAALLEVASNPVTWGAYGGRIIHSPSAARVLQIDGGT